ncbi:MAG: cytochrome-c peroxidase [Saprospiraceae bacterium]|nr:cytochrome-c peroxidase [Saprospiraceae bacterium]
MRNNIIFFYILLCFSFFVQSCSKSKQKNNTVTWNNLPEGFPELFIPEDNAMTANRIKLGRHLFYDPILSRDSSLSCASCHKAAFAFADNQSTTQGIEQRGGNRNVSSLTNVAYNPYFTSEGGVPTLEMQVLVPIQEHNEFDFNVVLLAERLQEHPFYDSLSQLAYERSPDAFVITRALAAFERTLISTQSDYDLYTYYNKTAAMSKSAQRGYDLFMSTRLKCGECHPPPHFSTFDFENNGLYAVYSDIGRQRLTNDSADLALFKIPTLRNIALSAPYMHDGSLVDLDAVIEHYKMGGKKHPQQSYHIKGFELSTKEKEDLLDFLSSLTDNYFIENENISSPFK